jgi:phage terminase small subunit
MIEQGKQQKEIAAYFKVSPAAVCKAYRRIRPSIDAYDLTTKEKKFVIAKLRGATSTQAALQSYEVNGMDSAKALGSKIFNLPKVKKAYDELMEANGLGQSCRVNKLKAHVNNKDPNVSLKALDMTFKLEGAYTEKFIVGLTGEIGIQGIVARHLNQITEAQELLNSLKEKLDNENIINGDAEQGEGED